MSPPPPVWRRHGLLFAPPGGAHPHWATHAQAPTVLELDDATWRIFVGGRDRHNRSHVFAVDVDPEDAFRVTAVHDAPMLASGPPGAFDEHGVGPASALRDGERVHLYYTGVARREVVPHALAVGLATSGDGGRSFARGAGVPVMASAPGALELVSTPCVRRRDVGFDALVMRGVAWVDIDDRPEVLYDLCDATSIDGIGWTLGATPAIGLAPGEAGLARPWFDPGEEPRIWFCARGLDGFRDGGAGAYRIHSAIRRDGRWQREGEVVFAEPPRRGDWDHAMQAYPCVRPWRGGRVMFYVGDGFGRDGFGWASAGVAD